MNGFIDGVKEHAQTDKFIETVDFLIRKLDRLIMLQSEKEMLIEEMACRMLDIEIEAFRVGYEEEDFKGVHPGTGMVRDI